MYIVMHYEIDAGNHVPMIMMNVDLERVGMSARSHPMTPTIARQWRCHPGGAAAAPPATGDRATPGVASPVSATAQSRYPAAGEGCV